MVLQYNHLKGVEMEDYGGKPELLIYVVSGANTLCKMKMKREPRNGGSGDVMHQMFKE